MNGKINKPLFWISGCLPLSFLAKYYYNSTRDCKNIKQSLHYKYIMDFIIQDKQFYNICGKIEKISKIIVVEKDEKYISYKVHLNGSKGESYVLIKLNKHDFLDLKEINEKQQFYTLLNRKEKNSYLYVPQNMSDVFILCEETLNNVKQSLNNDSNNDLKEKFTKYLNNIYDLEPLISRKSSSEEIDQIIKKEKELLSMPNIKHLKLMNDYKFWRINSIIISKDKMTYSIRPQTSSKKRGFELEDTYFKNEYLAECLKEIELNRLNSLSEIKEKSILSNLKSELTERKEINQAFQHKRRKNVMFFNAFLLITIFLIKTLAWPLTRVDLIKPNLLIAKFKKILENKKVNSEGLKIINSSYKYNFSNNIFYIKFHLLNNKGIKSVVNSTLEYNKTTDTFLLTSNTFKFPNKEYKDISDYETTVLINETIAFPQFQPDDIGKELYTTQHIYNGLNFSDMSTHDKNRKI